MKALLENPTLVFISKLLLAFLIISLMGTGLEVRGGYHFLGYERATNLHEIFAWILIGVIFFTTLRYFLLGKPAGFLKGRVGFLFRVIVIPVQVVTGLLYLYYDAWNNLGDLGIVATIHIFFAYLTVAFLLPYLSLRLKKFN